MIHHNITSIRTFIGSKDYKTSLAFYRDLGFTDINVGPKMSYMRTGNFGFYLQDEYVKDWLDNTMIFLEVDDVHRYLEQIEALDLPNKYKGVRLSKVVHNDWGSEFFLHDPAGALWHIGSFANKN